MCVLDVVLCVVDSKHVMRPPPPYPPLSPTEDIKEACVLDAVLCVVDSKHVMQHLDEEKPEGIINEAGAMGGGAGGGRHRQLFSSCFPASWFS